MSEPDSGYTKHATHTDALDTLGTIIGPNEGRDAIHVAVFPVEAAEDLRPGDHVGLNEEGKAEWAGTGPRSGAVGIVDPFIVGKVSRGDWFWLLVYPRQITSLRHVREHPSFPASEPSLKDDPTTPSAGLEALRADSEQWLRQWISNADCPDFHTTIGAMLNQRNGTSWGSEYVHFDGQDAHGEIPAEAWHHLAVYSGEDLSGERPGWFSCSC